MTRRPSRPTDSRPSAQRGHLRDGAPVAGAPGWYLVRRKSRVDQLLRRPPRFGPVAVAAAAGVAVLVIVLSLVRAHWGEAPGDRSTAILMPPVASSPGAGLDGPPAASAEPPAAGSAAGPDAPIEEPGGRQGASATAASRAKAEPAPPEETAASPLAAREARDAIPEWQSRPRPLASRARSQAPMGGQPSGAQVSRAVSLVAPPSSPRAAADPAIAGSTARPKVAGEVASLEGSPALPAGEIRVFIHHAADRYGDAALAQRLADHLRSQGFTVADIRPVDVRIEKPSVRYFFEDDRRASERLVDELGRFFEEASSGAPDHASDFTHFVPRPRPGNVEVWLPAS